MKQATNRSGILLETGTNELEIITFYLQFRDAYSGQFTKTYFGINAAKVVELIAMPREVTAIADSPDCVEGVFILRKRTITLIDLCKWFHYEPDVSENAKGLWTVVVAELNGRPYGFITHGVDKVYRVSWEQVSVPPDLIARAKSLTGLCLVNNQIIQMVDFERIIAYVNTKADAQGKLEDIDLGKSVLEKLQGKTVVIAEDSPTIRTKLQKILAEGGLHVVVNADGLAAWQYLENAAQEGMVQDKIAAIITDIEMPRMDGHHLCLKIKEHQLLKEIPVILCSSMINDALRKKGVAVGADDQLTKTQLNDVLHHIILCLEKQGKKNP